MKKLFIILVASLLFPLCAMATPETEVQSVFNSYVNAANTYSKTMPSYYVNNAKILRVVNKKEGGQKTIVIPFDRYLKELTSRSFIAKAVNYKNRYVNIKITKIGEDYKLSATRIPRNDKTGEACYFIFTKSGNTWKIKEESMTTNVQLFLSAK